MKWIFADRPLQAARGCPSMSCSLLALLILGTLGCDAQTDVPVDARLNEDGSWNDDGSVRFHDLPDEHALDSSLPRCHAQTTNQQDNLLLQTLCNFSSDCISGHGLMPCLAEADSALENRVVLCCWSQRIGGSLSSHNPTKPPSTSAPARHRAPFPSAHYVTRCRSSPKWVL